jgi:hypothetical protein
MSFHVIPYLLITDLIDKNTLPPDSPSSGLIVPFHEIQHIRLFKSHHCPWLFLSITWTIPPDTRQLAALCQLID